MILYLIRKKDAFKIGKSDNIDNSLKDSMINFDEIDWENSCYYVGTNDDITDLEKIIGRLFKKDLIKNSEDSSNGLWFSNDTYLDILMFIDTEINNGNFEITERTEYKKPDDPSEKFIDHYFYFLAYKNSYAEIGKINTMDSKKFLDENIVVTDSIILKFTDSEECNNMFESIRLDIPHTKKSEKIIQIQEDFLDTVTKLIKVKINLKSKYINFKLISLQSNKVIDFGVETSKFNSNEVCEILNISRQTLSNWRKYKKIDFEKISDRKYLYPQKEVQKILENKLIITPLVESSQKSLYNPEIKTKKRKLPTTININYKDKIIDWVRTFSYHIAEIKYKKQNFFLNFGNVGFTSSPHVMITNDFKLYDYIKKNVIIDNEKELWEYLNNLTKNGEKPIIDTSKKIYPGFSDLYLNKLFIPAKRHI